MQGFPQVCFIRNTVRNPLIEIGESLLPRMTPEELAVTVSVKVPMNP